MSLPYIVTLARSALGASGGIQQKKTWTFFQAPLRCDAFPLKDDLYFLQSGIENAATVVFHFYYDQDIKERDRVHFPDMSAIAGMPNSWFELTEVFRPRDLLQFIRAYGRVVDTPVNG